MNFSFTTQLKATAAFRKGITELILASCSECIQQWAHFRAAHLWHHSLIELHRNSGKINNSIQIICMSKMFKLIGNQSKIYHYQHKTIYAQKLSKFHHFEQFNYRGYIDDGVGR